MESIEQTNFTQPQNVPRLPTPTKLIFVGCFFVLKTISILVVNFLSRTLSCFMGCSVPGDTGLEGWAFLTMVGLIILTVIGAYGLAKRYSWARLWGIVTGVSFIIINLSTYIPFIITLTRSSSLDPSLIIGALLNPTISLVLLVLATGYLITLSSESEWIQHEHSTFIGLLFSVLVVFGLIAIEGNNYTYQQSVTQEQQSRFAMTMTGFSQAVNSGDVYTNSTYHFQFVTPASALVFEMMPGIFDFGEVEKDSFYPFSPYFSISSSQYLRWNESLDDFVKEEKLNYLESTSFVSLSGVPYIRLSSPQSLSSTRYFFAYNGRVFDLENSKWSIEQLDRMMQTLKFTDPPEVEVVKPIVYSDPEYHFELSLPLGVRYTIEDDTRVDALHGYYKTIYFSANQKFREFGFSLNITDTVTSTWIPSGASYIQAYMDSHYGGKKIESETGILNGIPYTRITDKYWADSVTVEYVVVYRDRAFHFSDYFTDNKPNQEDMPTSEFDATMKTLKFVQ